MEERETIEALALKVLELVNEHDDLIGRPFAELHDDTDANMFLVDACDELDIDDTRLLDNDCALANAVTRRFNQLVEEGEGA